MIALTQKTIATFEIIPICRGREHTANLLLYHKFFMFKKTEKILSHFPSIPVFLELESKFSLNTQLIAD